MASMTNGRAGSIHPAVTHDHDSDLRRLVDGGRSGLWDWDRSKNTVDFSPHLCTLLGQSESRGTCDVWQRLILPGDWPGVHAAMAAVFSGQATGDRFSMTHSVVRPDGRVIWVTNRGMVTRRDQDGTALQLTGIITDETERHLAEQNLMQTLERLRLCEQAGHVGGWYWDIATGKLTWSDGLYDIFGLTRDAEATFATWQSVVHPDDYDDAFFSLNRAIEEHQPCDLLYRVVRSDGTVRWIRAVGTAHYDPAANPYRMIGVCMDVTAERQAHDALKVSESRSQMAMESANIGSWDWNLITRHLDPCTRCLAIFGLPPGTHVTFEDFISFVHPDDRERIGQAVQNAITTGSEYNVEMRIVWPDGTLHWVRGRGRAYYSESGQPVRMAGVCFDITGQKRTERLVRDAEERYSLVALWDWNIITGEDYLSPRWKEILGYSPDELPNVESSFFESIHPDDRARVAEAVDHHLNGNQPFSVEMRLRHKDGSYRWVLSRGEAIRDESGRAHRMVGSITDITERRAAEKSLEESEKHHRSLIENLTDGFMLAEMICDPDGEPVDFRATITNHALEQHTGFKPFEVAGRSARELTPKIRPSTLRAFHNVVVTGVPVQFENYSEDLDRYFECRAYRPAPGRFAAIYRDITARKRDEQTLRQLNEDLERRVTERTEALRASEEKLTTILRTASDAIVTMDEAGAIQSINLAAERMFGYSATELVGLDLSTIMPSPHREQARGYLDNYLRTGERRVIGTTREVLARRSNGVAFPVELAVSHIEHLRLFTGIIRDISPRKELERDVVNIATMEQQRIGHYLHDECGQELTALGLLTDSLAELLKTQAPGNVHIATKIRGGIHRVLQRLRGIAKGLAQMQINAGELPAALGNLAASLGEAAKVRCKCSIEGQVHDLDGTQATHLYHIAQEACTNALRHGRATRISIRLSVEPARVALHVEDNGCGFAEPSPGGLGIRIMKHRANMMRGHLAIERQKPKKTVVTCILPRDSSDGPPA
ncbi:MAG: PAS domain-containing protein [Gemmataceae bacterium]|nr:PAS domain-containing protein [Gemmataceae bacterium]